MNDIVMSTHGINISAFFAGASTSFYTIFALYILSCRERTRFQSVLGWLLAVWAVWSMKDIIITFPQLYTPTVLNYIALIDGWSAVSYVVFIFEVTMPGWTTWRRVLLTLLPFIAFTILYAVVPERAVMYSYYGFLWFFAWAVVIFAYFKVKTYLRYIRSNYSNIDQIDVTWLKPVFFFAIVSQLAWLFTSIMANVYTDAVYYISSVALWLLVLHYAYNFHPITVEPLEEPQYTVQQPTSDYPFAQRLEEVMNHDSLYLNPDLTLVDLAAAVGTNRTYLSRYLSQVQQLTFYDFINQQRLEKKSIPLMQEHPEYTLEYIATESGFKSISTFRRAFVKLTGQSPGRSSIRCQRSS